MFMVSWSNIGLLKVMFMKFTQHIPNFVDGEDPHEEEFNSLEELLNIEY
jgi:hypothetical protein